MERCRVELGVSSCFMTRRYEYPESWVRIIKELGVSVMSLDSDMLDPFFSGDKAYTTGLGRRLRALGREQGVETADYLTGMASYRFLGLAHGDAAQRERMKEWFRGAIDIAASAGAFCAGGRCDAYAAEVLEDREILEERRRYVAEAYRELAVYAEKAGLESIYFEQMYTPGLKPYTLAETEHYIEELNREPKAGVPVRPVLDVGHACAGSSGVSGEDLDYLAWIRQFGAACPVIHLQQTREGHSDHLPFRRAGGYIEPRKIVEALRDSFRSIRQRSWRRYLSPVRRLILLLEVIPSTGQTDQEVLQDMCESVGVLREQIPEEGLWIEWQEPPYE